MVPDQTLTWSRYVQQYDITKGKRDLGFYPGIPSYEGLREIIEAAQTDGDLPLAAVRSGAQGVTSPAGLVRAEGDLGRTAGPHEGR
jgi:hypothetical protein